MTLIARMFDERTPAGAALMLIDEMHRRGRISIVERRAFELALGDLANIEAEALHARINAESEARARAAHGIRAN